MPWFWTCSHDKARGARERAEALCYSHVASFGTVLLATKQVTRLTLVISHEGRVVVTGMPFIMIMNEISLLQACAIIFIILNMRKSTLEGVDNSPKRNQPCMNQKLRSSDSKRCSFLLTLSGLFIYIHRS